MIFISGKLMKYLPIPKKGIFMLVIKTLKTGAFCLLFCAVFNLTSCGNKSQKNNQSTASEVFESEDSSSNENIENFELTEKPYSCTASWNCPGTVSGTSMNCCDEGGKKGVCKRRGFKCKPFVKSQEPATGGTSGQPKAECKPACTADDKCCPGDKLNKPFCAAKWYTCPAPQPSSPNMQMGF